MGRLAAVVLGVCAGCTSLFGLEPTVLVDADPCPNDRDCDGVTDEVDNCPLVVNPDIADVDGDGLGDACDPCAFPGASPVDDDDADGVVDALDVCPGYPDDQARAQDADGIGDACDPDPATTDQLGCFMDLADAGLSSRVWGMLPPEWEASISVVRRLGGTDAPYVRAMSSGLFAEHRGFAVQVRGYYDYMGLTTLQWGIGVGATATSAGIRCVVKDNAVVAIVGVDGTVIAASPITPQTVPTYVRGWLTVRRSEASTAVTCRLELIGQPVFTVSATTPALPGGLAISLIAEDTSGTFESVSVLQLGD